MKGLIVAVVVGVAVGVFFTSPSNPAPPEGESTPEAKPERQRVQEPASSSNEGCHSSRPTDPTPSESAPTSDSTTTIDDNAEAAAEQFRRFVFTTMKVDEKVISIELKSSGIDIAPYTRLQARLKRPLTENDVAFTIGAQFAFNEFTMDPTLRSNLASAMKNHDHLPQYLYHNATRLLTPMLSLLHEVSKGSKSRWAPWLNTFTRKPENIPHGILLSKEDRECLTAEAKGRVEQMDLELELMYNLTVFLCNEQNTADGKAVGPYTSCVSLDQMRWAYATVSAREFTFGKVSTMFPLLDIMPYRTKPTLRQGMLHRHATGQHEVTAVDIMAFSDVEAEELLTFRSEGREASEQLLRQGVYHVDDHGFGVPSWVHWDTENAVELDKLRCSERPDSVRFAMDGTFSAEMHQCAQLHVLQGAESAKLRADYKFDAPNIVVAGYEFLMNHADLAMTSIPSPESHRRCYDASARTHTMLNEIARHNIAVRELFFKFKDRVNHQHESKKAIYKAVDEAIASNDEKDDGQMQIDG